MTYTQEKKLEQSTFTIPYTDFKCPDCNHTFSNREDVPLMGGKICCPKCQIRTPFDNLKENYLQSKGA